MWHLHTQFTIYNCADICNLSCAVIYISGNIFIVGVILVIKWPTTAVMVVPVLALVEITVLPTFMPSKRIPPAAAHLAEDRDAWAVRGCGELLKW